MGREGLGAEREDWEQRERGPGNEARNGGRGLGKRETAWEQRERGDLATRLGTEGEGLARERLPGSRERGPRNGGRGLGKRETASEQREREDLATRLGNLP